MLARFDHGSTSPLERILERAVMRSLDELVPQADVVVLSDYAYGVITPRILDYLAKRLAELPCCLATDSRRLRELARLSPTVVKPNYLEAVQLLGAAQTTGDRVKQILSRSDDVLHLTGAKVAAVTMDEDGAIVLERGRPPHRTTAKPVPHSQAAGAGDSYLAAFALALASGAPTEAAAELAAAAAAVVVNKSYTATCSMDELLVMVGAEKNGSDLAHLSLQMDRYRRLGRRIVLTNGCFDILHRGHVTYLERAKSLGDILVVGVNTDESIRKLKGADRPINCLEDRLGVLAGLSCIDHLISFEETSPERLIEAIRPEVFVKGGDYTRETLPEAPLVEALGGRVVILPYLCDHSTTNIVQRIREQQLSHSNGRNGRFHHATANVGRRAKPSVR
jgi:D-beta-D-heptose 7-phosphate kinase/D-beta-D-heptose 1-phosphate adenosyltransferase